MAKFKPNYQAALAAIDQEIASLDKIISEAEAELASHKRKKATSKICKILVVSALLVGVFVGVFILVANYNKNNPTIDGVQYSLDDDGTFIVSDYSSGITDAVILADIDGVPVSRIDESVFSGCDTLRTLYIPCNLSEIGDYAFNNCKKLETVNITGTVKTIGSSAFQKCDSLMTVYIANGTTTINGDAFRSCGSLKNVSIPDSVLHVGRSAFDNIGTEVFTSYGNALYLGNENNPYVVLVTSVNKEISSCEIHKDTRIIAPNAFHGHKKLKTVEMGDKVIEIGDNAFYKCEKLANINISKSLKTIGWDAFYSCSSLTTITLPDGLERIEGYAFWCSFESWSQVKTSINIPKSVTYIGLEAFNTDYLRHIYFEAESASDEWDAEWDKGCKANKHWGHK